MVKALATIKGYYDYGMFAPIQIASVIAMRECGDHAGRAEQDLRGAPRRRLPRPGQARLDVREAAGEHVRLGEDQPEHFKAGEGTIDFCLRMMDEAEVALAPGRAFGENGEGFVRIALVENEQRLRQAMSNLERALNPRQPKPKRQAATA